MRESGEIGNLLNEEEDEVTGVGFGIEAVTKAGGESEKEEERREVVDIT